MGKPWLVKDSPWKTESLFYGWVRGQLRRGWARHPIKHMYIRQNRFKAENKKTGKITWHMNCECCLQVFPQSFIEIDHKLAAGSFTCKEDIQAFVDRLYFIDFDSIRAVCKDCHEIITHQEKNKLNSFFEALVDKEVVKIMKLKASELKKYLQKYGVTYVTPKKDNKDTVRQIVLAEYNDKERDKYVLK